METLSEQLIQKAENEGLLVFEFSDVERIGRQLEPKPQLMPPKPEDLCTICYTSGTTGQPKGVMLTHGNIIACTVAFAFFKNAALCSQDVMMSYLPLAHMYERVMECNQYEFGGSVGFFSGDIRRLADDMKELKPTVVPLVPRILNRIFDKVISEVDKSFLKKATFHVAFAFKSRDVRRGIVRNDTFFDRIVFKKIREQMGGRVRVLTIGSAPTAHAVLSFARAALGCIVVEGYGQTECSGAASTQMEGDPSVGHVGQTECSGAASTQMEGDPSVGHVGIPLMCNAIKLVDVPELGYYAQDDVGEICIRGFNVFKGYYKNEEATKEAFDADGWLHTGDIGQWNANGTLTIIDRKKHIFKLQQVGEICIRGFNVFKGYYKNEEATKEAFDADGWLYTGDIGQWNANGTLTIIDRKKHIFKLQQGEYIAPEKIENIYIHSKFIAQLFVHGESLKSCLVAVVVPDEEASSLV
uniref:long-chain-fatty-acid--CoA ligase n=1 Tax=Ascaris lumbricoides TaxID=6252 RepID=A0A0M3IRX9_ASCLU